MKNKTDPFNLSYVVCTKNRLPFLRILNEHIFPNIRADEEVVVVDGGSTDGSAEYLKILFNQGVIHQYLCEPDNNQAHGWNKGLLMARGRIIKKIIDDDVHDLAAIRQCAIWMDQNPAIDLCISNILVAPLSAPDNIRKHSQLHLYLRYKNREIASFPFGDVSMLIRKNALARSGLFDTQFVMMDWEFSLRCSFLGLSIIYFTGFNALAVDTPGNVTSGVSRRNFIKEQKIGKLKYDYPGDLAFISAYSRLKVGIGNLLYRHLKKDRGMAQIPPYAILKEIYDGFYQHLAHTNHQNPGQFIDTLINAAARSPRTFSTKFT